jgi:hypothetical protein
MILKSLKCCVFVSADCKGVKGTFLVSADSKEFSKEAVEELRADFRWEGGIPPVFCKRVRKLLIVRELAETLFLKSA